MRTLRRPVAAAAGMTLAAGLAVADLSTGGTPADAHSLRPIRRSNVAGPPAPEALAALRQCESSGNYGAATGNGYYGAYQFAPATWRSLGYGGLPHQAPPVVQDEAAAKLWSIAGWRPWPGCRAKLRLR
ncbi:MAG TPA: transglycosylase family protein [Acidimicrobiales bacterium]|nr:transglycosylase family protein [Acidimicrobiales bacterium]